MASVGTQMETENKTEKLVKPLKVVTEPLPANSK